LGDVKIRLNKIGDSNFDDTLNIKYNHQALGWESYKLNDEIILK